MKDRDVKRALADIGGKRCAGSITRRRFLHDCARLGLGFSAAALAGMGGARPLFSPSRARAAESAAIPDEMARWLRDTGTGLKGSSIRMISESTPPSIAVKRLVEEEFTPLSGIEVQFELLTLERVLQRTSLDISARSARYDIYYIDQSWVAMFAGDTVDPLEKYRSRPDLAMPGYDWDDFLPALILGLATHKDRLVGIPFDIPLFIMFYRADLFDELGLAVPGTMDQYMAAIEIIQEAKAPAIYGSTGQMKAGHYSLNCDWTAWLWAHGGSVFDADGFFSAGDVQGLEGLDYMLRLKQNMPPHVTDWTWDGQIESLLQGLAGVTLTWAEMFPTIDNPMLSQVAGRMEAAPPPRPKALRSPADCGYGEIPNIAHQGGSVLSLSRHSTNQDAAWIFLQWATSADVQARASLIGGGASPTRGSVFDDPRILEAAAAGSGTTRHFAAVRKTMETDMGSEPDVPVWPELSNGVIPQQLGRLLRGVETSPKATMAAIKAVADEVTRPYRA